MREQADGDGFGQQGVGEGFLFAFLIGNQDGLSGVTFEEYGAAFSLAEVSTRNLLPIDERESEPVGKKAEFFHQAERQRRTSGTQYMQEADLRVES